MKKLRDKWASLHSAAKAALEDAEALLSEDKYEEAKAKREEAEALIANASEVKAQLDAHEAAKSAAPVPARLPFDDTPDDDTQPKPDPATKTFESFYTMRFGETDEAVKTVTRDLYGAEYEKQRVDQHKAFVKYLRYGDMRLSLQEQELLRTLIYTPDVVKAEVLSGYSVAEIRHNKTDQQEASLELGGALVPEDWRAELLKRLMGLTVMRQRARVVTTARDAVEWPRLEGGGELYTSAVRVTWVDEIPSSATVAQTNATFGLVRIPVHTVMARTDVSRNLLEDSGMDIAMLISELFAEAMAVDEDAQFLVGEGSGRPRGVLGNRSGAEQTPDDGIGTVNSGNASALTPDGLIDLAYELDPQYYGNNLVWIGNKAAFRDIRKMKDGNGDYLWARGLERGAPPTVLDYDYLMSQSMPSVSANSFPLVFGDPRGYMIVDRVGMTVERVIDAETTGRNKVAIFARRRLGGQVTHPWLFKAQKVSA